MVILNGFHQFKICHNFWLANQGYLLLGCKGIENEQFVVGMYKVHTFQCGSDRNRIRCHIKDLVTYYNAPRQHRTFYYNGKRKVVPTTI